MGGTMIPLLLTFAAPLAANLFCAALRVYTRAMLASSQPNMAISSCSLAPASAARTAPIFRSPCGEHCGSPASKHQPLKMLPKPAAV